MTIHPGIRTWNTKPEQTDSDFVLGVGGLRASDPSPIHGYLWHLVDSVA